MKISVVILNWNRPEETEKAVTSVLNQQYDDFEIILWDNASSSDVQESLKHKYSSEPRIRLHITDQNYGVAGGRNRAFKMATGNIIVSLDSDAIFLDEQALKHIDAHFRHHPNTGALAFEVVRPDGHLMWPFSRPADVWRKKSFPTIRIDGCGFAVGRDAFFKAGAFAEHFSPYGAEDQHFSHKLLQSGFDIIYDPTISIEHAFSTAGRTPLQFQMHTRNLLLIPLELFPVPDCWLRFIKQALQLLPEARGQKQTLRFLKGACSALASFSRRHRKPYSRTQWNHFKSLVDQDKNA